MAYLGPSSGTIEIPDRAKSDAVPHPLSPITAAEITTSSKLLRSCYPPQIALQFKVITLQEPRKEEIIQYLDAEHKGTETTPIKRRSFVAYYIANTVSPTEPVLLEMRNVVKYLPKTIANMVATPRISFMKL